MFKYDVLRCILMLYEGQPEVSAHIHGGLNQFRLYVESLNDPLPVNLLDHIHDQKVIGMKNPIKIRYKEFVNDALKEIEKDGFSRLGELHEKYPDAARGINSLKDLQDLVEQLKKEHGLQVQEPTH